MEPQAGQSHGLRASDLWSGTEGNSTDKYGQIVYKHKKNFFSLTHLAHTKIIPILFTVEFILKVHVILKRKQQYTVDVMPVILILVVIN